MKQFISKKLKKKPKLVNIKKGHLGNICVLVNTDNDCIISNQKKIK